MGATIAYEVGLSTTFSGSGTFSAGLSATLPDDAKLVANVNTPDQSSATGFDTASATPKFDVQALSASATVAAFAQPKLILGIVLTDIGAFDVNIAIKTPIVSATFTAAYSKSGSPNPKLQELTQRPKMRLDFAIKSLGHRRQASR